MEEQVVTPEPEVVPVADPEGDIWDKYQSEGITDGPEPTPQSEVDAGEVTTPDDRPRGPDGKFVAKESEQQDVDLEQVEPVKDTPGVPGHLPYDVRKHWESVPDEARNAFANSYKAVSDKLTEAGRQAQYFQPIVDTITKASREMPNLAGMTSGQIASDIFEMAKIQSQLATDPVGTILEVADRFGARFLV